VWWHGRSSGWCTVAFRVSSVISTRVLLSTRSRARMQSPEARVCIRAKMLHLTPAARGSRTRPCAVTSTALLVPPPTHTTVYLALACSHTHTHTRTHTRTTFLSVFSPSNLPTQAHTHTHVHTRAQSHSANSLSSDCAPDHLLQAQLLDPQHTSRHASTLAPSLSRCLSQPLHESFVMARLCAHSHHRVPCPLRCGPDKTTTV
jgi:hypothetical protein